MKIFILQLLSMLSTAIGMVAAWAHLLAFANKMKLPKEEYLIVQKIYRGWALIGIVAVVAVVSTAALAVLQNDEGSSFYFSLAASVGIAVSLAIFFAATFPANKATENWTILPANWEALRRRWEYSHVAGAILYFLALTLLCLSLLSEQWPG
jgi:hypothetical protein